jgi:hypothetical protein
MRAESRFIQKIQAAENQLGISGEQRHFTEPAYSSPKTSTNKGLYIEEYVDTGRRRSLDLRGSTRCDAVSRCPFVMSCCRVLITDAENRAEMPRQCRPPGKLPTHDHGEKG